MRRVYFRLPAALALGALVWACQDQPTAPLAPTLPVPGTSLDVVSVMTDGTGPLTGAIFTTTVDGTVVNENVRYEKKEDVYLDGGPGPNAPAKAAGLPEGDYYFQVTDPSGKDLLSTDHISCRRIHVNADGVIDLAYEGTGYEWQNGKDAAWVPVSCKHNTGVDQDHFELGAITVQLFPYDDTPNPGGVYKAWVTPVDQYAGDPDFVPEGKQDAVNGENYQPGNYHGFIPRWSKTDNYKVKQKGPPFVPPEITVRKFHDRNLNGIQDEGEEDVTGWAVEFTDPIETANSLFTPETVLAAEPGDYTFIESTPAGTLQTVAYLDGVVKSQYPSASPTVVVPVLGTSGETHEVVYGNVGLGDVTACKVYDRNGDGTPGADEPGIPGWKMALYKGDVLVAEGLTGEDGCVTFSDLLPGAYTVKEILPTGGNWEATGPTSHSFNVVSTLTGASMSGGSFTFTFLNCCKQYADFGTKGYWHNKNGLSELTEADIAYVNTLAPYASPSSYFGAGDEPFDGFFSDGTLVAAAFSSDDGSLIWGEGTAKAEVSHFLVDANAGGDPREQLAQQLLAFIFNVRHRLDGDGAAIWDGSAWIVAGDLIGEAITVWSSGTPAEQNAMQERLNALNENDAVPFIPYGPCEVVYP